MSKRLPKVLVAHPGTQHAPQLAGELSARDLLHRFWTGFALSSDGLAGGLLRHFPESIRRRLARRVIDVPWKQLRTTPLIDWQGRNAVRSLGEEAAYHERNRRFQEAIPDSEILAADVVVGFDTSSWVLAKRAKALGRRFILDQSIGHPAVKERTFEALRAAAPDWSSTAPQKRDMLVELENREHEQADLIVVASQFVKRTLVDQGVRAEKIRIIPYGADLGTFRPPRYRRNHDAAPCIFLFAGSLSARKGVPCLLAAWRKASIPNAELWLAGPGSLPRSQQTTLPANVTLLGHQSRADLAALMQRAHVFVFPSHFEGLAIVQIEAQCTGLPLIATPESGATELLSGDDCGYLVPAGDAEALAERMASLAAQPNLRRSMETAAVAVREQRSWRVYGDRWAAMIQALRPL